MRPFIIGIGGGRSGAGKTTVACRLLEKLPGWGAIKFKKTAVFGSIIDDITILSEQGKDTRRFLDAGAERVLWVRSDTHDMAEILHVAIEMLSHLRGIIVEGNSAIGVLEPDAVVYVSGADGQMKQGAEEVLGIADIVLFDRKPPRESPECAKKFRIAEIEACVDAISEMMKGHAEKD